MAYPDLRVSDQEREETVEQLREHAAEGRLDADELDARLTATYAARTRGELAELTRDLPERAPPPPRRPSVRQRLTPLALKLAVLNVFLVAVWLLSGGPGSSFWPVWVMLLSVVALLNRATHEMSRGANAVRTTGRPRGRETRRDRGRRL
jgi:Domain of unknown function (DUF1707)